MSASQAFVGQVLSEFAAAFQPLQDALAGPSAFGVLIARLGWNVPTAAALGQVTAGMSAVGQALTAVNQAVTALEAVLDGGASADELIGPIQSLASAIADLTQRVRALEQTSPAGLAAPFDASEFWQSAPGRPSFWEELLGYLVYARIEERLPQLFGLLRLVGLLESRWVEPVSPNRVPYQRQSVRWDRIGTLVANLRSIFTEVYGWGGEGFDDRVLVQNLAALLRGFGIKPDLASKAPELDDYFDPTAPYREQIQTLRALLVWVPFDTGAALGQARLNLVVVPIPPSGLRDALPGGFALYPVVDGQLGTSVPLAQDASLSLQGSFSGAPVRLEVRFDGATVVLQPQATAVGGELRLIAQPAKPWILLGSDASTRLELASAHVAMAVTGTVSAVEYRVEAAADAARLIVDFSEGDGFLQRILGTRPQSLDLGVGVTWSSRTGLSFNGQATPEVTLPAHESIANVLKLTSVHVALAPGAAAGSGELRIGMSGSLQLGPLTAVVDDVGLRIAVRAPAAGQPRGNLGDLDLQFGFKPPRGVGLSIDTGVLVGGGFLLFDAEKEQYVGVVQLELAGKLQLSAIGLLTTRMPDGSRGFSLLILISATFSPPVQLGYGFTLDGVGGLLGLNRTASIDALRSGLRTGALGSILFPTDPIRNIPQITSDLQAVFPPATGRFIFGPMVRLGWGTPRLLTIELAILLELPEPVRLLVLSRMRLILPDAKHAIVRLQLDAVGMIDFSSGDVSLDAVLYDSQLAQFAITGEMALRARWSGDPFFVLAIGGFNPRFQAPPDFPALQRVAISLATGDNPRLRLEAYLALTTNTVQFGALAELAASAGPFSINGHLGFDVLMQLAPFGFVADLSADVALKFKGESVMSVSLVMTLVGPTPWHAWGEARYKFLIFKGSVGFDVRFGQAAPPPLPSPVDVLPLLSAALVDVENWGTQVANGEHPLVSFVDTSAAVVRRVHPLADLRVSQRVVPLDRDVSRFGSAVPLQRRFSVGLVDANGGVHTNDGGVEPVREPFAPAQFRDMTDDEKLTAPAFEPLPAGLRFAPRAYAAGADSTEDDIVYERTIFYSPDQLAPVAAAPRMAESLAAAGSGPVLLRIGASGPRLPSPTTVKPTAPYHLPSSLVQRVAASGAVGRARIATSGAARFAAPARGARVQPQVFIPTVGRGAGARRLGSIGGRLPDVAEYSRTLESLRRDLDPRAVRRRRVRVVPAYGGASA